MGVYLSENGATSQLLLVYLNMAQFLPDTVVLAWESISHLPFTATCPFDTLIVQIVNGNCCSDVLMSLYDYCFLNGSFLVRRQNICLVDCGGYFKHPLQSLFDSTPKYSGTLCLFGSTTKGVACLAWSEFTNSSSWAVGHNVRDCPFNPSFLGCQLRYIVLQFSFAFSSSPLGISFACIKYMLPVWPHIFALPFF